jgi:hypothetical protein
MPDAEIKNDFRKFWENISRSVFDRHVLAFAADCGSLAIASRTPPL